jgi:hypothetical protein
MSGTISAKLNLNFDRLKEQTEVVEAIYDYHKDDDDNNMIHLTGVIKLLKFLISEGEKKGFYKKEATK